LRQGCPAASRGRRDLRRDGLEALAAVDRAKDDVARAVEDARVVLRQNERSVPVEAMAALWSKPGAFPRSQVAALHVAVLALEVDQVGILGIDSTDKSVAAADHDPVVVARSVAVETTARSSPAAIILQSAINAVRLSVVDGDMVELPDGDVRE